MEIDETPLPLLDPGSSFPRYKYDANWKGPNFGIHVGEIVEWKDPFRILIYVDEPLIHQASDNAVSHLGTYDTGFEFTLDDIVDALISWESMINGRIDGEQASLWAGKLRKLADRLDGLPRI